MCSSTFVRILPAVALASASWAALSSQARAQQPVTIELPGIEVSPAASKRAPRATTSSGVQPDEVVVSPTALPTPSAEVASSVTVIDERNTVIATACEQQAQVAREVDNNLTRIRGLSSQSAIRADQTSNASRALADLATGLTERLKHFQL